MRVLCFIPAYNEYSNLKSLISKIEKENYMIDEFLFIDSGSTDGSLDIIKKSGHKYISLNENRGLGYLFINALDYSIQHNFDICWRLEVWVNDGYISRLSAILGAAI